MTLSVFDLFRIGVGPSSSHTVGPMRAAAAFVGGLGDDGLLAEVDGISVELFGSLAATGRGHRTLEAVALGLEGEQPATLDPVAAEAALERIRDGGRILLAGRRDVPFPESAIVLRPLTVRARHSNALTFTASARDGRVVRSETWYSVGGGFIVRDGDEEAADETIPVPFPFGSGAELLALCAETGLSPAELMLGNEVARRERGEVRDGIRAIRRAMEDSCASAVSREGLLPGGLGVRRRAPGWSARLSREDPDLDPRFWQERVTLVALAVNEENASGGRIVTAPTNGAAGVVPAVLFYALHYVDGVRGDEASADAAELFLLTAAAFGGIIKRNASISGAEVGCQGEIGSACSMAAAGLAAVLGGTPAQIENAAEIGMEHNLGLTCDPIGGLVQVPCIERNAIAATKAIAAARMALWGDGEHRVSFDEVVATMRQTGADMGAEYKETARGGLAVNVVEC